MKFFIKVGHPKDGVFDLLTQESYPSGETLIDISEELYKEWKETDEKYWKIQNKLKEIFYEIF